MNIPTKKILIGVVSLALVAGAYWVWQKAKTPDVQYKLTKVEKGNITATVSASGILNPVTAIQVGSQVSGQIKELLVDFNSEVKANQLIARIDPESYEYRVRQAQADLDATRASSLTQQANVNAQKAELNKAEVAVAQSIRDLNRKKELLDKNFISATEYEKAESDNKTLLSQLEIVKAQQGVAQAQLSNAVAVVKQREALLSQAKVDLEHTNIRSPVDGIVVKRSIELGQTVAASLQAPELFIIAKDLQDMQVEASIDESEIGRVQLDQIVNFTVDAFPGRTYEGVVKQIRKAAQNVSNVVTYTVIVTAANPGEKLLPGMTANVKISVRSKEDILKVASAALRFKAPNEIAGNTNTNTTATREAKGAQGEQRSRDATTDGAKDSNKDGNKAGNKAGARRAGGRERQGKLTVLQKNNTLQVLPVKIGISDGAFTEVSGDGITEGLEVILGVQNNTVNAGGAAKPAGPAAGPRMF